MVFGVPVQRVVDRLKLDRVQEAIDWLYYLEWITFSLLQNMGVSLSKPNTITFTPVYN